MAPATGIEAKDRRQSQRPPRHQEQPGAVGDDSRLDQRRQEVSPEEESSTGLPGENAASLANSHSAQGNHLTIDAEVGPEGEGRAATDLAAQVGFMTVSEDKSREQLGLLDHRSSEGFLKTEELKARPEVNKARGRRKKNAQENPVPEEPALLKVDRFMMQWYTIDTMRLVQGEELVRKVLVEAGFTAANIVSAVGDPGIAGGGSGSVSSEALRRKVVDLCRRLDLSEAQDEAEDSVHLGEAVDGGRNRELKPLPATYDALREEAKLQQLKMMSYLQGKTEFFLDPEEAAAEPVKVVRDDDGSPSMQPVVLPLVDKYARNALRRRIVHDQLNRV